VSRRKHPHVRLSVFKGREAKLNKAIFQTLAHKARQTAYDIYKELRKQHKLKHVRYATVNKRVRILEETGYINKTGKKKTKAGFEASTYELTAKTYLAILLDSINLEDILKLVNEATAQAILSDILLASN